MAIDDETIKNLAEAPKKTVGDEGSVEERSISELIEADRYLQNKEAIKPPFGLRIARVSPRGTI
jgi:hypothetical protein